MTTAHLTAGEQLRQTLESALEHARQDTGQPLEWDEKEQILIELATDAANRAQQLRAQFLDRFNSESTDVVTPLTKLSAEIRLLDKQVADLIARINPGVGEQKSERHVRAANARWARNRRYN